MARVRSLKESVTDVTRVHPTEVDCTWQVLRADDGTTFLPLSTYGSDYRMSRPKVSQTLQLDRAVASELVRVLMATFDLSVSSAPLERGAIPRSNYGDSAQDQP